MLALPVVYGTMLTSLGVRLWQHFIFKMVSQERLQICRKATCLSVYLFVRPHRKTRLPTDRLSWNFDTWVFLKNPSPKFKFHWNMAKVKDTLHRHPCIFMIIYSSVLLRMRNASNQHCRKNQTTYVMFNFSFFSKIVPFLRKILYSRKSPRWQYGACALHSG